MTEPTEFFPSSYDAPAQVFVLEQDLRKLPLFIDGSDGSMWPVNHTEAHWDLCADPEMAKRRFVRVSDLLALFSVGVSPNESTVIQPPIIPLE